MNPTWMLVRSECRLVARDHGSVLFGLCFPAVLLLVLGALPGFTDPDPALGDLRLIEVYTPIVLVLTFAMVGVSSLAQALATYRAQGVLRRLRVTPIGPARLLGAQFVAHLLLALAGSALALLAAMVALDLGGPRNWWGFALGLTLAAAALFAIGLVVGSLAPTPATATTLSLLVWMSLMVLAGLWFPREAMPPTMRTVSDLTPAGAAVDVVQAAWFSGTVHATSLTVLVVSVAVLGLAATATFRWE